MGISGAWAYFFWDVYTSFGDEVTDFLHLLQSLVAWVVELQIDIILIMNPWH